MAVGMRTSSQARYRSQLLPAGAPSPTPNLDDPHPVHCQGWYAHAGRTDIPGANPPGLVGTGISAEPSGTIGVLGGAVDILSSAGVAMYRLQNMSVGDTAQRYLDRAAAIVRGGGMRQLWFFSSGQPGRFVCPRYGCIMPCRGEPSMRCPGCGTGMV